MQDAGGVPALTATSAGAPVAFSHKDKAACRFGGWPGPGTCPTLRVMPGDHHTPWTLAGEEETLVDFLDYLRGAVIRKASGLPAATVRRPMVGSGTSCSG